MRRGTTLLEIVVAGSVLAVAFSIYAGTSLAVRNEARATHEVTLASFACQRVVEAMRAAPFDEIFARWNHDRGDDPDGAGTAPGVSFDVPGLSSVEGDDDGLVGEVLLPEIEVQPGVWQLREDSNAADLGMPRDLNGDSVLDDVDHSQDYFQIPVCVRARWNGRTGPCKYELYALLVAFRR